MERLLDDHADVAETIFAYLPPSGYRYVAGVSRTLRNVYGRRGNNKTSVEWAMATPQTAAIFVRECLDHVGDKDNDHDDEPIVVTRHKACTYAAPVWTSRDADVAPGRDDSQPICGHGIHRRCSPRPPMPVPVLHRHRRNVSSTPSTMAVHGPCPFDYGNETKGRTRCSPTWWNSLTGWS
jgi:hypothetical protein